VVVVVVDLVGIVVFALLFQFPGRVRVVVLFELMPVAQGVELPVALLQRRSDRAAGERAFLVTEIRPVPFSSPAAVELSVCASVQSVNSHMAAFLCPRNNWFSPGW